MFESNWSGCGRCVDVPPWLTAETVGGMTRVAGNRNRKNGLGYRP